MMKEEEHTMSDYSPNMETLFSMSESQLLNLTDSQLSLNMSDMDANMLATMPIVMQHHDETTMDVATKFQVLEPQCTDFIPVSRRGAPERLVDAGALNFQVEISGLDTHRKKYLYSSLLNRIYVDMKTNFSVQFRWDYSKAARPMYVRATVVFSDVAQAEKRVERCTQHTHETDHSALSLSVVKNVLHSSRDMSTHGVYYCGVPELADSWYSVLVEFPGVSAPPYRHAYQFVCKNSCCNGINRRAIDIIFELEDSTGYVHGRQTVGARVCSCPRRDIKHDEGEGKNGKKRVAAPPPAEPGRTKKVKLETVPDGDDELFRLPQICVVGVRGMLAGLTAMLGVMEYDASLNPQAADKYTTHIATLKRQIDHYKGLKPHQQ